MKYCSTCGNILERRIPEGDDRERFVCNHCHTVHYENPKVVVGCIPEHEGSILLCRRAIEPRCGFWTLPAGYLENGETVGEGAAREVWEEAEARVEILSLFTFFNLPDPSQIHLFFRSRLMGTHFGIGAESLDVRLFREEEIPWKDLAFTSVRETLKLFFKDRKTGFYPLHLGHITRNMDLVLEI